MREDGTAGVLFGGVGNTQEARPFVMADVMYATVELNPSSLGQQAVNVLNMYHTRGSLPGDKYDIQTDARIVLGDPASHVKQRIFAHYDKTAVPFIHWTLNRAEVNNTDGSATQATTTAQADFLELGQEQ